jgi:hypothetical protein
MIKKITFLILLTAFVSKFNAGAQFYKENSGEFIFAFSNVIKNNIDVPTKMRFTLFFHAGQNMHYDFTNNVGFFSGYGLRNIGIVTEEDNKIIKRRTYALGVPLALKIGSFKDHVYLYGGGEMELFFHYKQKIYIDGDKSGKLSEWFSSRTKRFVPSFFAGIQFPGGINLKFKYYPLNFLNTGFDGYDFDQEVHYSDFNKTQLFYFSLSFNFKSKDLKKLYDSDGEPGRIASL